MFSFTVLIVSHFINKSHYFNLNHLAIRFNVKNLNKEKKIFFFDDAHRDIIQKKKIFLYWTLPTSQITNAALEKKINWNYFRSQLDARLCDLRLHFFFNFYERIQLVLWLIWSSLILMIIVDNKCLILSRYMHLHWTKRKGDCTFMDFCVIFKA